MTCFHRKNIRRRGGVFLVGFISLELLAAPVARAAEYAGPATQVVSAESLNLIANEVAAINDAASSARARKEKQISQAVRDAVLRATKDLRSPGEVTKAAVAIAAAAAEAAPTFAEEIARAAAFAGPVARTEGANAKIRAAAFASAKHSAPARGGGAGPAFSAAGTTTGNFTAAAPPGSLTRVADEPRWTAPGEAGGTAPLGRNSAFTVTGAVSVSHESNLFLQSKDEVAETILAVKPGVDFRFGQKSQAHGGVGYQFAFTKYVDHAGSNSTLGNGTADFAVTLGSTALSAAATYQQVEQGSRDTASVSGSNFIRRNILALDTNVETALTAKTGLQTGVKFDQTDYERADLLGSKNITVPLKVYVDVTSKLAVSAGLAYDRTTAEGGGQSGHGLFYNVGLRGNLSEKLSSNFSVGYRTRDVGDRLSEGMWAFDGTFNLQASSKTAMALVLSRNYSTSASGETLTSTGYFFNLTTAPTLGWQLAGGLGYRAVDYGPKVFAAAALPAVLPPARSDDYWEFNLSASYAFTRWMNATAAWSQRINHSNEANTEFANSVLSLVLGFRY